MELRALAAFVAVAEEGGLSAAARRLHLSQPALSQTVRSLERELGVDLLVRTSTGARLTGAGTALLAGARDLLARHDRVVAEVAAEQPGGEVRIGVPLELPADLLPAALVRARAVLPGLHVEVRHLSSAAQAVELEAGRLDLGFLRERLPGPRFDAMPVVTERLGVLLPTGLVEQLAAADGVRLEALGGLRWIGFPRSESPAWWDVVAAGLRAHGIAVPGSPDDDRSLIAPVKFAAVQAGDAFALAPDGLQPLPAGVGWCPLAGAPLVRRTWATWSSGSRRRDVAAVVAALEPQSR